VAITVRDDADWHRLRAALGDPEWARDPELFTAAARRARADEIDEHLAAWCATRDRFEVAETLQAHGVPAGPMLTATDQLDDPHFAARGYPRPIVQPDLGPITMEGPAFRATGMADVFIGPAPKLGEHTRDIARDLLGLDDAEVDRLFAAGVLEGPREEKPAETA
jgi:crotonobetainyl-CoA:carnitine CoA-transferase CaiB-like acyl-CoA transferase